jgi:hypothetical protein
VPVGVSLLLLFALAFVLTTLASRRVPGPVQVTSVVQVPVEVPVVREKIVTQVVIEIESESSPFERFGIE